MIFKSFEVKARYMGYHFRTPIVTFEDNGIEIYAYISLSPRWVSHVASPDVKLTLAQKDTYRDLAQKMIQDTRIMHIIYSGIYQFLYEEQTDIEAMIKAVDSIKSGAIKGLSLINHIDYAEHMKMDELGKQRMAESKRMIDEFNRERKAKTE